MPNRIYLDKRAGSPNWYIFVYDERSGQCERISTRTTDHDEAQKKLAKFILSSPAKQRLEDPTLIQVLLRYWELHGSKCFGKGAVKTVMGVVAEQMPKTTVAGFTRTAQKEWVEALPIATATQKRYLGVIQSAMTFVHDREEIADLPKFYRVKVEWGAGAKPLSLEYLRSLCESAVGGPQMFMALAIGTLSRPCALLDLTWDRVDFTHNVIKLHDPERKKTKKVRPTVPMGSTLRAYLLAHKSVGYVVKKPNGHRYGYHRTMFNRLKAKAKVTGSAYGIRKAGGSWLRSQGVPELDIKGMLGHRMTGVTETYAEYDPKYMRAAADATEALLKAVGPSWLPSETPGLLATHLPVVPLEGELTSANPLIGNVESGAGNETRTRDLNLGKVETVLQLPLPRAANDD